MSLILDESSMEKYKAYIYANNIDGAKSFLLDCVPKDTTIYKYFRGVNRDWNSIIKSEIWLSQADNFNDPFDCAFLYNCRSKESYDRDTEHSLAVKEHMDQSEQDKISQKNQQSVFASCFSEKCDSMLMWSHYASEHKGLCMGYDLRTLIEKYNFFPVIYRTNMLQEKLTIGNDNHALLFKHILTKSDDWSYENEWRIVDIDFDSSGKMES